MLGIFGVLFLTSGSSGQKSSRDANTAAALAKAKNALLAYALSSDSLNPVTGRPGQFPCPSTVSPTSPTHGQATATCVSTPRLGRLPWKTLGIQELFDGDGEPLWYAVSNKFRTAAATKINSDALGDLTIYSAGGSNVLSSQVVAIVFAAGAPVAGQNRTGATSFCTTTSTSIAGDMCASNYLDTGSGRNNATNAGPFVVDRPSPTFNDQLALISTADFVPKIEERIVAILNQALQNYYATNSYYPYAANYSEYGSPTFLNCANGVYSGRFPFNITAAPLTGATCTGLAEWPSNSFPPWFTLQEWHVDVHYVIGKAFEKGGTKACGPVGNCLTVNADTTVQAAFILPGIPTQSQTGRPSATPADYLEVSANVDEWPTPTNYTYATTPSTLPTRDRVVAIKN